MGSRRVAFLAEYDALPGLGHACGHNLIAAIGVGAALALAEVADELDLTVEVYGTPAPEAMDRVVATDATAPFRQLIAVDAEGRTAIHSGPNALGTVGEHQEPGAAAAGNLLASADVPRVLVQAWSDASGPVEARLLAAVEAAMAAGGEAGPVHSAAITVVSGHGWRTTDLRVDWSDDPLAAMRELVELWLPQRDDYILRAEDPARSPGYGVPGDDR
jgi:uncharacterized Ntn-hydrolase superfamily protein